MTKKTYLPPVRLSAGIGFGCSVALGLPFSLMTAVGVFIVASLLFRWFFRVEVDDDGIVAVDTRLKRRRVTFSSVEAVEARGFNLLVRYGAGKEVLAFESAGRDPRIRSLVGQPSSESAS